MSKNRTRIAKAIRVALDETGLPWSTERGGRHLKVRLQGRFVAALPLTPGSERDMSVYDTIATIRRVARLIRAEAR